MLRIDFWALPIICGLLAFSYWTLYHSSSLKTRPRLLYSSVKPLLNRPKTWLEKWAKTPNIFFSTAIGLLLLALMDPHKLTDTTTSGTPQEGIALYLALDRSGSMGVTVDQRYENGQWQPVTRFDRLKEVARNFIQKTPNDLIGVIAFARAAQVISPLTLTHSAILKSLDKLELIQDKAQDGTAIGYAIYKTAHLIEAIKMFQEKLPPDQLPPYLIKSAVLVVITDGLQDPHPLDRGNPLRTMELEQAAAFAKEKGVRIYIINIEPRIVEEQFAPNRHQMQRITESTGGQFLMAENMQESLDQIFKLEKSRIHSEEPLLKRISFFPILTLMALLLLGANVILKATIWRQTV